MYKASSREDGRRSSNLATTVSMGFFKERQVTLQGTLWALFGLAFVSCDSNASAPITTTTTTAVPQGPWTTRSATEAEDLDDGSVALVIICLIMIFLTICAISLHYCNFKSREKYDKLERENELVEVDLFESEEDA